MDLGDGRRLVWRARPQRRLDWVQHGWVIEMNGRRTGDSDLLPAREERVSGQDRMQENKNTDRDDIRLSDDDDDDDDEKETPPFSDTDVGLSASEHRHVPELDHSTVMESPLHTASPPQSL